MLLCMLSFIKSFLNNIFAPRTLHVAFDSGAKNKPTIILLHGIAATSVTWNLSIKELDANKNRIIALDLLGFGKSPKPKKCEYLVEDHVKYVRRTLKKLSVKRPYTIVGHSMGSIIAARYCRIYSRDVKASYLLSLPLYLTNNQSRKSFSDRQTDVFINVYKFLLNNKDFTIKHSQRLRKFLRVNDGIDVTEETWNGFRLSLKNTIINQDTYSDIKNSKIPIDIIYGDLDEFLVQKNVDQLAIFDHVTITKLHLVNHSIGTKFSKIVAQKINQS